MSVVSSVKFDFDPKKRALFEQLLRQEKIGSPSASIVRRRTAATNIAPLSFAQERLWFLDQLEPNSAVYNLPLELRLKGQLNVPVLRRCLEEIVRRHEALRTRFEVAEGEPMQVIESAVSLEMPLVDLSPLPLQRREAQARRLTAEEAQRPFNLQRDLMLRASLIRLEPTDHRLILNMHHIASDGWSVGILLPELRTLYTAFVEGKASPLPELPIQYADYAVWQREWLQGELLEGQLSYWKKQLRGAPALLDLRTDRPRLAIQSHRGALMSAELPKPLTAAVKKLSRAEGATPFMTLLAAFHALLHRYTGGDDILIGTVMAGRNRAEVEPLIGFFVNTLVMRGDMSGDPSFRTFLGRIRDVALEAYSHQDLPFERLVEELHPERNLSHAPVFQVAFALQNAPWETPTLPGLEVTHVAVDRGTSKFDLCLIVRECEESLQIEVEYSTGLFDSETIGRLIGHYQTLLEGIVSNPDQTLSELPLLTQDERQYLLVDWNRTELDFPSNSTGHELFEAQAGESPGAIAAVFENEQITYRELNRRANQLAHRLQKLGVGPDVLVGLAVERSLDSLVGLLGILKAGGAYVPLDPSYPKERLSFMMADTALGIVVTQRSVLPLLPENSATRVCLDTDWNSISTESADNPMGRAGPRNLAYVIYTSGSTGQPKGVLLEHRGLCNLARLQAQEFEIGPGSRVLQFASIGFDASVSEVFTALTSGATLCLAAAETLMPGPDLQTLLRKQSITVATLPPSVLAALPGTNLPSLRTVVSAGEACTDEIVHRWANGRRFINAYGPTEATVCATSMVCGSAVGRISIGKPIANARVYILDRHLQPVPIGVAGELHIGGVGLARGYHNRPDLTTERFISNPFGSDPGSRLYKSGDLARYLPDGTIEYLGRLDHQVKIRGFRIELGEIETVLTQHPGVKTAAVVAREDTPGEKRLAAYVVSRNGALSVSELREFLGSKLPHYMVPSAFVMLDALPLSPNGKVDRRALPGLDRGRRGFEQAYVAPRTPVEVALARIWAETLRLEQVGIHDNFFHLGGHSLLAARMLARAQKTLKQLVPLATVFRAPTIAALAEHFESGRKNALDLLEPVRTTGAGAVVLCFGGHLIEQLSDLVPPEHPLYWCKPEHVDGRRTRHSTVEGLAAHYCDQITAAGLQGPYVLCGFSYGGLVAFETARQLYERNRASVLLFLMEPTLAVRDKEAHGMRVVHHLLNLPSVPRGQRASYVYTRVKAKVEHSVQFVRRRIKQFYCGARLAFGRSVPVNLRWLYAEDRYIEATQKYMPHPFPGKLVLIHGKGYSADAVARLASLCLGEVSIHRIQATDHINLVSEPQWVENWANLLRLHLSRLSDTNNSRRAVSSCADQGSNAPVLIPTMEPVTGVSDATVPEATPAT